MGDRWAAGETGVPRPPELLAQFTLNRFDLSQQTGRLSVKPQDMDFAVDALGNATTDS